MLTVFVSDAVVTAVILNTTFIRALTSFARANTAVQYSPLNIAGTFYTHHDVAINQPSKQKTYERKMSKMEMEVKIEEKRKKYAIF